ncbi:MAG: hypothetical protein IJ729_06820 [Alloprevotella sp.]|nr:hypothetical protein [Alloprevotella sp.]
MAWSENVILIDAAYLDRFAHELAEFFKATLGRNIPKADLALWLDYVALDAGLQPGDHQVQAIFLHPAEKKSLDLFTPGGFAEELDGKAFRDNLGEFTIQTATPADIIPQEEFFLQCLETVAQATNTKRIMLIGDMLHSGSELRQAAAAISDKDIVLFTPSPKAGSSPQEVNISYGIMAAFGIKGEELG